jgi:hypothetical protein
MHPRHAHRFWRGLAVGGAVVVMALPAAAAYGQTAVRHDPAHDVVRERFSTDGSEVAAAHNKTADVVLVRYTHTNRQVETTMRIRDYGGHWEYWEDIKTPTRKYLVVGGGRGGHQRFDLYTGSGYVLTCDGLSATVDRIRNTFRVSVPRSCLGQPRWVRAHVQYDVLTHNGDELVDFNPRSPLSPRLYKR